MRDSDQPKPWNACGVEGVYRFLGRVWRLFVDEQSETEFEQAGTMTDEQKHAELLKLIKLNLAIKDVAATATQAELEAAALTTEKIKAALDGKTVKKVIVVPKKMLNIVAA